MAGEKHEEVVEQPEQARAAKTETEYARNDLLVAPLTALPAHCFDAAAELVANSFYDGDLWNLIVGEDPDQKLEFQKWLAARRLWLTQENSHVLLLGVTPDDLRKGAVPASAVVGHCSVKDLQKNVVPTFWNQMMSGMLLMPVLWGWDIWRRFQIMLNWFKERSIEYTAQMENAWMLESVAVAREHQRKGFGSYLMQNVIAAHQDHDNITFVLHTQSHKSVEFYRKVGFYVDKEADMYIYGKSCPSWFMVRPQLKEENSKTTETPAG